MYNRLKRLYDAGSLTQAQLRKAVDNGWISEEEYLSIIGGDENI